MITGDQSAATETNANVSGVPQINKPKVTMRKPSSSDPIGTALRRLHDEIANEPLPSDFLKLIAEIDKKIEEGKG